MVRQMLVKVSQAIFYYGLHYTEGIVCCFDFTSASLEEINLNQAFPIQKLEKVKLHRYVSQYYLENQIVL